MVFALAVNHHLEISNNVPFKHLADFSSHFGRWLPMEFIPKNDPLSQMLLPSRKDIFQDHIERSL